MTELSKKEETYREAVRLAQTIGRPMVRPRPGPVISTRLYHITPMFYGIGRNQFCPCGSGKKFKKCCIKKQLHKRK